MSVKLRPLFTSEPIDLKRDAALRALERALARLRPADLADPSLPAKLAGRLLPRPPRLGTQVRYRLFEIETGPQDEDRGGLFRPARGRAAAPSSGRDGPRPATDADGD